MGRYFHPETKLLPLPVRAGSNGRCPARCDQQRGQASSLSMTWPDLSNLRQFAIDCPPRSFLGRADEAAAIPAEHRAQIHFLNQEATEFVAAYLKASYMYQGGQRPGDTDQPFRQGYFQTVERLRPYSTAVLKKWLYRRGIPFRRYVLLYANPANEPAVLLTWKMVIKYSEQLFWHEDHLLFDDTLNWGLVYDHSGELAFGRNRLFNPEEEYQKMAELRELQARHPFLKLPY